MAPGRTSATHARVAGLAALLAAAVLGLLAWAPSATAVPLAQATRVSVDEELEPRIVAAINSERRSRGLKPLRVSRQLSAAAERHARSMARLGFFAHESADGTPWDERILRTYKVKGYSRWTVGENLLWRSPDVTPVEALEMWMSSPDHRRVLLTAAFREVGLSVVRAEDAPAVFRNLDVTIVVADFGVRR